MYDKHLEIIESAINKKEKNSDTDKLCYKYEFADGFIDTGYKDDKTLKADVKTHGACRTILPTFL